MDLNWLFFSHEGRLNRQPYWMVSLAILVANMAVVFLTMTIDTTMLLSNLCVIFLSMLMIMPNIKRLHDRNRSGWFLLLTIIPIVNIWIYIEIWFLKGTEGENRFGVDPLAEDFNKLDDGEHSA